MTTEKLVEVIDCLRNVRARHIIALRSMAEKEKQLDADGATLLSSAHYALEEHERSKAKHRRAAGGRDGRLCCGVYMEPPSRHLN
eukprot:scaffold22567_cov75-Isochrysis_galbana.AAC.2